MQSMSSFLDSAPQAQKDCSDMVLLKYFFLIHFCLEKDLLALATLTGRVKDNGRAMYTPCNVEERALLSTNRRCARSLTEDGFLISCFNADQ